MRFSERVLALDWGLSLQESGSKAVRPLKVSRACWLAYLLTISGRFWLIARMTSLWLTVSSDKKADLMSEVSWSSVWILKASCSAAAIMSLILKF